MSATAATYLALGDSYTVGESVKNSETWPYLLAERLNWKTPKVIAQTGWKTYELLQALDDAYLEDQYNWVTLLIGVNNQYRQVDFEIFQRDLEQLSDKINTLIMHPKQVLLLSIPDYSVTPFVEDKDRKRIASELAMYNYHKKAFAHRQAYQYCDITQISQQAATHPSLVCSDKLHPSAEQYRLWASHILQQGNFDDPF